MGAGGYDGDRRNASVTRMDVSVCWTAAAWIATLVVAASGLQARADDAPPVLGDATARSLYADCGDMAVAVESRRSRESDMVVARAAMQNALESRIRAARIYAPRGESPQVVYAEVAVAGEAFRVTLELHRRLVDTGYGLSGTVRVWGRNSTGVHGRDPQYVLGVLSELIDVFVVEYVRANASACANGRPQESS